MTYLVAKFNSFFPKKDTSNPAFSFFFETKSREKKRLYTKALKKAQKEQELTLKNARVKKL
jgi:hypothetical protein